MFKNNWTDFAKDSTYNKEIWGLDEDEAKNLINFGINIFRNEFFKNTPTRTRRKKTIKSTREKCLSFGCSNKQIHSLIAIITKRKLIKGWAKESRILKKKEYKRENEVAYEVYINSDVWTNKKAQYYQKYDKVCAVCGTDKDIHLHHLTYKRFKKDGDGAERDTDLIPLCKSHHFQLHEEFNYIKRWYSLKKFTNKFILDNTTAKQRKKYLWINKQKAS